MFKWIHIEKEFNLIIGYAYKLFTDVTKGRICLFWTTASESLRARTSCPCHSYLKPTKPLQESPLSNSFESPIPFHIGQICLKWYCVHAVLDEDTRCKLPNTYWTNNPKFLINILNFRTGKPWTFTWNIALYTWDTMQVWRIREPMIKYNNEFL